MTLLHAFTRDIFAARVLRAARLESMPSYHTCCWHFGEIYKKKKKKKRFGIRNQERRPSDGTTPGNGQVYTWFETLCDPFKYSRGINMLMMFIVIDTRHRLWWLNAPDSNTLHGHA